MKNFQEWTEILKCLSCPLVATVHSKKSLFQAKISLARTLKNLWFFIGTHLVSMTVRRNACICHCTKVQRNFCYRPVTTCFRRIGFDPGTFVIKGRLLDHWTKRYSREFPCIKVTIHEVHSWGGVLARRSTDSRIRKRCRRLAVRGLRHLKWNRKGDALNFGSCNYYHKQILNFQ